MLVGWRMKAGEKEIKYFQCFETELRVSTMRSSCKLKHVNEWMNEKYWSKLLSMWNKARCALVCGVVRRRVYSKTHQLHRLLNESWRCFSNLTVFSANSWTAAHVFLNNRQKTANKRGKRKKNKKEDPAFFILTIFWFNYKADSRSKEKNHLVEIDVDVVEWNYDTSRRRQP